MIDTLTLARGLPPWLGLYGGMLIDLSERIYVLSDGRTFLHERGVIYVRDDQ